jgi:hypothetical protein
VTDLQLEAVDDSECERHVVERIMLDAITEPCCGIIGGSDPGSWAGHVGGDGRMRVADVSVLDARSDDSMRALRLHLLLLVAVLVAGL